MNLILFESSAPTTLPRTDSRVVHLLDVLRRQIGDTFDAGLINGPRGKGTLATITDDAVTFTFAWASEPPPLDPITVIVGLPRPQTARKILQEATALGVARLHFVLTEKGEANYASSTLWQSGEWRRHLIAGAEQAFCTRLPEISHGHTLTETLATLKPSKLRIALDNYESSRSLNALPHSARALSETVLAVGPERGWSTTERERLRTAGFELVHLGPRVLRVETACVAALAGLKMRVGFW